MRLPRLPQRPWQRGLVTAGVTVASVAAGIGVSGAIGSGADAPAEESAEPTLVEIVEPASFEEPPPEDLIEALLSAPGDEEAGDDGEGPGETGEGPRETGEGPGETGEAGPSLWAVGLADASSLLGPAGVVPAEVAAAHCPEDDPPGTACLEDAAALLARLQAAPGGEDDGEARARAREEVLDLLCGADGAGDDACRAATDGAALPAGGAGGGEDDDVLIDLCAGPEPFPGCDEGMGGTVTLAITQPVAVYHVDFYTGGYSDSHVPPLCSAADGSGTDQLWLRAVTNQPAGIEGTATPRRADGSAGDPVGFSGAVTDEARALFDGDPAIDRTVTCATLDRPGEEFVEHAIELVATGDGEAEPGHWSGVLPIWRPPPPTPAADLLAHDPARPPIEILPSGREVVAHVYRKPAERASVVLVRRDPEAPHADRCQAFEDGRLDHLEHLGLPYLTQVLAVGRGEFSVRETFQSHIPERWYQPGAWDACVLVTDGLTPPSPVERHALLVVVPELVRYEVVAQYRGVDTLPQPTRLHVAIRTGASTCTENMEGAALEPVDPGEEHVLCTVLLQPGDRYWSVGRAPDYRSGRGVEASSLVRAPDPGCIPDRWISCRTFYVLDVYGPAPGGTGPRVRHGLLELLFRPNRPTGPTSWEVGGSVPYGETTRASFPRLAVDSLHVQPDPSDPAGSLAVRWRADRPAEALVRAEYWPTHLDPRDPCAGGSVLQRQVTAGRTGRVVLDGACAGSRYRVSIHLRDVGADRWGVGYVSDGRHSGAVTVPLDPARASGRTDRMPIRVSFDLELESLTPTGRRAGDRRVIPQYVNAHAGSLRSELSQEYHGRARVELYCDHLSSLNRSVGPETIETGWQLIAGVSARLKSWGISYGPDGSGWCPNVGEQLRRDQGRGSTWHLSSRDSWDVRDLLDAGEVRFQGEVLEVTPPNVVGGELLVRATLTVRAEPVDAAPAP